jgi:hypothetical protein
VRWRLEYYDSPQPGELRIINTIDKPAEKSELPQKQPGDSDYYFFQDEEYGTSLRSLADKRFFARDNEGHIIDYSTYPYSEDVYSAFEPVPEELLADELDSDEEAEHQIKITSALKFWLHLWWAHLPRHYKAFAIFALAIGITTITLASATTRYAALSWLVPFAPFVLLMGFLVTTVTVLGHGLHVALQSPASDRLREKWEGFGLGNLLLAVAITAGVVMILLPSLATYFFPGSTIAHFFSPPFTAPPTQMMFPLFGAALIVMSIFFSSFRVRNDSQIQFIREDLKTQYQNTGKWAKGTAVVCAVVVPAVLLSLRFVPAFSGGALAKLFAHSSVGIVSVGTLWTAGAILLSVASMVTYLGYLLMHPSDEALVPLVHENQQGALLPPSNHFSGNATGLPHQAGAKFFDGSWRRAARDCASSASAALSRCVTGSDPDDSHQGATGVSQNYYD